MGAATYTASATATCTDGSWNTVTCDAKCATGFSTTNMFGCAVGADTASGSSVTFNCNPGYVASGTATNAIAGGANTPSGSTFTFACDGEYTASGVATCTDGSWDSPTCVGNACSAHYITPNGVTNGATTASAAAFTFACASGYTPAGTATCSANTWPSVACGQDCAANFAPTNGVAGGANTASGASYTFTCDAGYTASGVATCTAGSWDAQTCDASSPSNAPSNVPTDSAAEGVPGWAVGVIVACVLAVVGGAAYCWCKSKGSDSSAKSTMDQP